MCVTCDKWQTATVHKLVTASASASASAVVTWTLTYLHNKNIIYVHVN